jgi:hypothetical protein
MKEIKVFKDDEITDKVNTPNFKQTKKFELDLISSHFNPQNITMDTMVSNQILVIQDDVIATNSKEHNSPE